MFSVKKTKLNRTFSPRCLCCRRHNDSTLQAIFIAMSKGTKAAINTSGNMLVT